MFPDAKGDRRRAALRLQVRQVFQQRRDAGVEHVSEEQGTLYQRALDDYAKVMVFGSTYFTVQLKAKAKNSQVVKNGFIVVKRDPDARLMEVVLWKELQK